MHAHSDGVTFVLGTMIPAQPEELRRFCFQDRSGGRGSTPHFEQTLLEANSRRDARVIAMSRES